MPNWAFGTVKVGLETAEDGNYDIIPLFSVERPE